MKKRKKWPWIVLACAAVAVIVTVLTLSSAANRLSKIVYTVYDVQKGDITTSITASGTLEAQDSEEVVIPEGIEIDEVLVSVGSSVRAGDRLASVDALSAKKTAAQLEETLSGLDAQLSAGVKETASIASSVSGRVMAVYANKGDTVADVIKKDGCLALISTGGQMYIDVETDMALKAGDGLTVKWDGGEDDAEVYGRVEGRLRVVFNDDKAPLGEKLEILSDDKRIGEGRAWPVREAGVFAGAGVIDDVGIEAGDKVSMGTKLFSVKNGGYSSEYYELLQQREDVISRLKTAIELANDPFITSPCDGVVKQINTGGDIASQSAANNADASQTAGYSIMGRGTSLSSGTTVAAQNETGSQSPFVLQMGAVSRMTVYVGELDISRIRLGQSAEVTLDAFPKDVIKAEVTAVSSYGENSGGMTNYSVELMLEEDERLLSGMNGSAVIVSDRAQNVLIVPIEAICEDAEGEYVYVSSAGDEEGKDKEIRRIETGLADADYAEVKSGLDAGEKVVYVRQGETMMDQLMSMREHMMNGGSR